MQLYSTNNPDKLVTLREAVFRGLPPDNGLYMPVDIPTLPPSFIRELSRLSFQDIAFEVAHTLIQDAIPVNHLHEIIQKALYFPAPLIELDEQRYFLELFHGPSLAFKDFGARFMAQLMQFFLSFEDKETTILVATSGDTGAAVAAGFYGVPHIKVVILYPSKKVSELQEKQLTTWGGNVTALEIKGTFDDCQRMVKEAFLDKSINMQINLSSANSINIARLIPQSFYYFEGYKQLPPSERETVFVVPSGNFGNLTAGLMAKKMGLPIHRFIAATNQNRVVPDYLNAGLFIPRPSIKTLSNAMDVGNPSNFDRILDIYCSTWNIIREEIKGFAISEQETRETIRQTFDQSEYITDPHGAVGLTALRKYLDKHPQSRGVVLGTAHYAKFLSETKGIIPEDQLKTPSVLENALHKTKSSIQLPANYSSLKEYLLGS
jgi:threonine synthase